MKKIAKKIVHKGMSGTKRVVSRSDRLKRVIKGAVLPYIGVSSATPAYTAWVQENYPDGIEVVKLHEADKALAYRPLISVLIPTYNTDLEFLDDCIRSVQAQVYDNWELCIVDDASPNEEVREAVKRYAKVDPRIKYKFLKENQHIANATNSAAKLASGEFLALFDHDDLLWPNALHEVVKALNNDKKIDFIYTDEDKITENRHEHLSPFFKPDANPDFLHSVNYVTHFSVIRKTLYEKIGGERPEYNGAQDWDLILRIFRATKNIHHIPKMLYSWRIHSESTAKSTDVKPYVVEAQKKAIEDDLLQKGRPDAIVAQDEKHPGYWKVTYPVQDDPLVSIVIPSKNQYKILKRCIDSIYEKTSYKNFEIVLVDTGSDDPKVLNWYKKLQQEHDNFVLLSWPEKPFSYAKSCNEGARVAKGDILIMLNNDTEVLNSDWLELLAGDAQREEIGAVGCLLFYPDGRRIQHAGVGVGLGGVAANSFQMMMLEQPMSQTQHLYINTKHNMTAVTAACLAIRRSVYEEVGGFDEEFRITYNDVDLCLRLHEKGYLNLYTPHVRLLHHESISLGTPDEVKRRDTTEMKEAVELFKQRWQKYIDHDPALNPNLSKDNAFYEPK
ncbi:glycosyltransferase family 2 protein [Candidatus Saccharibacteria bacterium]|nr:glycosyltransferase family 2 protein [Candidatus Saccharibacteria bacterium]